MTKEKVKKGEELEKKRTYKGSGGRWGYERTEGEERETNEWENNGKEDEEL